MKKLIVKLAIINLIILTISCQNSSVTKSKTVDDAVREYYKSIYKAKPGPDTDIEAFLNYNREEVLNTLEISEIKEIKERDIAIAFTRFSIGTTIVRQGLWFRRIKDNWKKTAVQNLKYRYKYVGLKEKDDDLKKLIEEKKKWEDGNPEKWWIEYLKIAPINR